MVRYNCANKTFSRNSDVNNSTELGGFGPTRRRQSKAITVWVSNVGTLHVLQQTCDTERFSKGKCETTDYEITPAHSLIGKQTRDHREVKVTRNGTRVDRITHRIRLS